MATLQDDWWTVENIDLLVEKRIANDAIFKQTNSERLGWLQVVADMKKEGGSYLLNRINTRKQWFKICELYKESLPESEDSNQELLEIPYYIKLKQFFNKISPKKSKLLNQDPLSKIESKRFNTCYSDRWTEEKTEALIDARIARHSMFQGRGYSVAAWKQIVEDLAIFDDAGMTFIQVKKKWENLVTKYKNLHQSESNKEKWPFFKKMEYFYREIYHKKPERVNEHLSSPARRDDKWTYDRTCLLINRRIARDSFFGRRKSTNGWQEVVTDLINDGAPKDLTIADVKKKWENLLTRHKVIKDLGTEDTKWHYFQQMEKYHKVKKHGRSPRIKQVDVEEIIENKIESIEDLTPILDEKLTKCRLCQKTKGVHSLSTDNNICEQILKCTSINVCEDIDLLPSSICDPCKKRVENFYKFLILCEDVDKELKSSIEQVEIKSENVETNTDNESESVEIFTIENSSTLECPECPASFTCAETFETHLKSHKLGSTKYHCDICNMQFLKQSTLFSHIKEHFDMDSENLGIEIIEVETNEANSDNEIVICEQLYHCESCSQTFDSSESLQEHYHTHSKIEHRCPRVNCNKKFSSLYSLRHHEMRHLGMNSFLCTVCAKGFVTSNALKMHEKIHSEVKEHVCEICSRGFSVLSNLKTHQKKHHEGHRYYCSKCPKEFLTNSSLQRHELVHTGIKDFVCDTCSSAFFTLKELNKHKRYHDGTKLYHCNECYKTFYEKHHLTIHNRTHTGERPYVCKISGCTKAFKEKQKLNRHEKTAHTLK